MMLFIHTIDKVLSGEKTQTRRLIKPNHHALNYWRTELGDDLHIGMSGDGTNIGVVQSSGRDMWRVFSDYAVQPGRGKPAVARIQITGIRREDVRGMDMTDARAEGFINIGEFMMTWCDMHDRTLIASLLPEPSLSETFWTKVIQRPADRYQAWVLEFKLVQTET